MMTATTILLSLAVLSAPSADTATVEPPPQRWSEAELGYAHHRLSGDRSDWREAYLRGSVPMEGRDGIFAEGRRVERFGISDAEGRGGGFFALGPATMLEVEGSVGPGATVLPRWSLGGHIQTVLGAGWTLGGGARHSNFADGGVTVTSTLVEHYFDRFRAAYRLSIGLIEGERAPNHFVSGSWYPSDRSQVSAGVSFGREIERTQPQLLIITPASAATVWGHHWVGPRVGVTYGVAFHRYDDLYDRTRVQLGVRARL
jgi:YaiO family outer membrane protein